MSGISEPAMAGWTYRVTVRLAGDVLDTMTVFVEPMTPVGAAVPEFRRQVTQWVRERHGVGVGFEVAMVGSVRHEDMPAMTPFIGNT